MSNRIYELCEGDDVREMRLTLLRKDAALAAQPVAAILKLIRDGEIVGERPLILDENAGEWWYHWTDEDFEGFPRASYRGKVYATFEDGSNGTFPTRGYLEIFVLKAT